ncbi:MAG TPA: hypothetical protein VLB75_09875 [Steroidobacteraceae bacterium]|nr:hypothetical protein [Steroidobacteraceae bacterium]
MEQSRLGWIRKFLVVWSSALVLGAGLVLAAQGPGRAEWAAELSDVERQPLWVPGGDVPMAAYIGSQRDLSLSPPR